MPKATKEQNVIKKDTLGKKKKLESKVLPSTKQKKSTKKAPPVVESKFSFVPEYYDLPISYDETVVKVLYQSPKIIFVYWEISKSDREKFIATYGDNFFDISYPLLTVHNQTKNCSFEIPINDYANSWYINIDDNPSNYSIKLCRKFKELEGKKQHTQNTGVIDVAISNSVVTPSGHILIDQLNDNVYFRNVKTNHEYSEKTADLHFIEHIGKVSKIERFYQKFYNNDLTVEFTNPSSMSGSC